MTPTTALILRDDDKLSVVFTPLNVQLKDAALESSALVARVSNADENAAAVAAQSALREWLSQHEKAEEAIKKPLNTYKTNVIRICREDRADVEAELMRVSRLVGDFQTLEQAKVRAAEAARNAELSRLEQERSAAAAQVKSHEALEAVNEHFNRKAADLPVMQATRAEGQVVKTDWAIEVTDIWLLARCHTTCVNVTPRLSEIKELLKLGVKVQGIKATPIVNSTVRAGAQKVIEV